MLGKSIATALAATAMAAIAAPGAFAQSDQHSQHQQQSGQGMGGGMMDGMMGGMMGGGMMKGPEHMAAMREARIAYLKTALGITQAQMGAWNSYVEALQAQQAKMQGMGMQGAMMKGTAIERMDARVKHMQARLEAMKAIKPATEALYNALNAEQKKKADKLLGMGMGRGMM